MSGKYKYCQYYLRLKVDLATDPGILMEKVFLSQNHPHLFQDGLKRGWGYSIIDIPPRDSMFVYDKEQALKISDELNKQVGVLDVECIEECGKI